MINSKQIILAGATPYTRNLGVSALFFSTVVGVNARLPDHQLLVFDHGTDIRDLQMAEN